MLDWCRCVCKRAGQHQCFDSGLVRPHYFTPGRGTATTQPACLPACPYTNPPTSRPPSLLRSLSVSVSRSSPPSRFSILSPYNAQSTAQSLSNFHPVVPLRYSLSLLLYRSRNDTIGLSLSSRAPNFLHVCAYTHSQLYKRYLYGLPFTVDYIRNLTPCTSETTVSIFNCAPDLSRLIFRLLGGRDVYWILGIFQPPFPPFFLPYGFLPVSLFFLLFLFPPPPPILFLLFGRSNSA